MATRPTIGFDGTGLFDVGGELVDETLRQATLRCIEIQKACPDLGLFQPDGRGARHGLVRRQGPSFLHQRSSFVPRSAVDGRSRRPSPSRSRSRLASDIGMGL
jgi:hypothetical protein